MVIVARKVLHIVRSEVKTAVVNVRRGRNCCHLKAHSSICFVEEYSGLYLIKSRYSRSHFYIE